MPLRWVGAAILLAAPDSPALTHYVDLNSTNPTPPFISFATAATNIQDAVDVAVANDEIVVTNGVYQTGGRAVFSDHTNRIVVTTAVAIRSMNGPAVTIIRGVPGIGATAARCAYLGSGATLSGFTLTDGGTRN